jgi:poly(A) polymerase
MEFSPLTKNLLKTIFKFSKKKNKKLYIVGGYLRDILLNRSEENPDIDFCLRSRAINFGRELARKLRAGFVVLDKENGACRIVKRMKEAVYTLDFTDFRGKTLDEDLLHRDFTINTFALELEKAFTSDNCERVIIDHYGGSRDLKLKIIRLVNKRAFDEDPLRILRAFSFSCIFGFKIDEPTLRLIGLKKNKLSSVSFERMRDELFKILDSPCAFEYLRQMDKLKILKIIFPEIEVMRDVGQGPYHHLDVWEHTLETVRQLELLIRELKDSQDIQDYLNEIISSDRRRRALIKLGALLHDIGKPEALRYEDGKTKFHGHERIGLEITENVARRLRLSNDEMDCLKRMVFWHLRPGYLADNEEISPRAKFRYFRDTASEAVSVLLISIADQRSTKGPLTTDESRRQHEKTVFGLIKEYFRKKKEKKPKRIINGNDLINKFKLEPSPLIGKVLREIEELQAIGKVKGKKEALKIAEKIISGRLSSKTA